MSPSSFSILFFRIDAVKRDRSRNSASARPVFLRVRALVLPVLSPPLPVPPCPTGTSPTPTTTANVKFAKCFCVCRVYSLGHSANKFFAECCHKNTRQKKHSVKRWFAECQKKHSAKMRFVECFFLHSVKEKIFFLGKKEKKKNEKNIFAEWLDLGYSAK